MPGYPWRCLCLGLRLQITRTTPRRRTILQCSQIGLTLLRTFIFSTLTNVCGRAWNNSGTTDHSQGMARAVQHSHAGASAGATVRTRGPASVTATVCSK